MMENSMNPALLADMLASRPEIKIEGDTCLPIDDAQLTLLLASNAGPVPLSKIKQVRLGEAFLTVDTPDGAYLLPYAAVVGARVEAAHNKHPGFRR